MSLDITTKLSSQHTSIKNLPMMIKERIFTIACSKKGGSKEMTASI